MRASRPYLLVLVGLLLLAAAGELPAQLDTARHRTDSTFSSAGDTFPRFRMTRSPTTAVLLSIVPGLGQVYNQQYWKTPIFLGAATFFVVRAVYYNGRFLEKKAQYDTLALTSTIRATVKAQREFYRDNRDLNAAYFLGVEILNMIDAYVGAHLFDFDVGEDLTSHLYLDPVHYGAGVEVRW
jgi:hypothetical protein